MLVRPVLGNRKYLLVAFQRQFQGREILLDVGQQDVQFLFRGGEKYHVIGISEIVPHPLLLLDPMVEVGKHQVCEVLAQIVADRHAVGAVDDRIEQGERILAFDFAADDGFQYVVVYRRVELPDVDFEAISGVFPVFDSPLDIPHRSMNAAPLDAAIRVFREDRNPYRFEDIHDRMMQNAVGVIRQSKYDPLFRLIDRERAVFGVFECTIFQRFMQGKDIRFTVLVVK